MSYILLDRTYRRLTVTELRDSPLEAHFKITQPTMVIEKIVPHLYICGNPSGSLRLELMKGSFCVWKQVQDLNSIISECGKTKTHYHGYIAFESTPAILEKNQTYTLILSAQDYSFSEFSQIGWVRPAMPKIKRFHAPFDFKLVEIKNT